MISGKCVESSNVSRFYIFQNVLWVAVERTILLNVKQKLSLKFFFFCFFVFFSFSIFCWFFFSLCNVVVWLLGVIVNFFFM